MRSAQGELETDLQTRVTPQRDPNWEILERRVLAAGRPLSLPSRALWSSVHRHDARLVTAHDEAGNVQGALGLERAPTRALPGHFVLRAEHAGAILSGPAGAALISGVARLAREEARVLWVNVEVVLRTPEEHRVVAARMEGAGFRAAEHLRQYRDTLVIDLQGSEEDILASFSATTRRDLRGWADRPVEMRAIVDARYSDRLNQLARETFGRTGGQFIPRPWPERIALCRALPEASRLVGLFRAGRDDPDALLAYAWGCAHGDHAHYDDAGSTRVDDIKVSLMYPLMWDLVRWARQQGCTWFDMGGAVPAEAKDDPRLGISDFKRRFSKEMVAVGAEWTYEPHPTRARIARGVQRTFRSIRGR
jgi:hypothetical protein